MTKFRTLVNSIKVPCSEMEVYITIRTHCPRKWAFVDMETGDIWVKTPKFSAKNLYGFSKINENGLNCLRKILNKKGS